MEEYTYDVIIIGAGAAGLMAALELVQTGKKVAVVEARDRVGGRIHTVSDGRFDELIEMGAEFVHGDLELTTSLLKKARLELQKTGGSIWQNLGNGLEEQEDFIEDFGELEKKCKKLINDIPVAQFIREDLQDERHEQLRSTLRNYVEGYYAADTGRASTRALCEELTSSDDVQYRVRGGYSRMIQYIQAKAEKKGCFFFFSEPVQSISWSGHLVEVATLEKKYAGRKLIHTVSLGVWQSRKIRFLPDLPEKEKAVNGLGFGPVIKILLQFETPFWKEKHHTQQKDLQQLGFLFSREVVPTWWTQQPVDAAMLTGWLGGPNAEALRNDTEQQLLDKGLGSLSRIFAMELSYLQKNLKAWQVINWSADPYSCGGYAYEVVGGPACRRILREPVANKLFFAGEGLYDGPEIGTVEAALISGRETAYQVVASFSNKE